MTTSDDKREALTAILAAHPGNSWTVQCVRIRAALSRFSLTTFEAMRHLDVYDPRARVLQLRKAGESIKTTWGQIVTESGRGRPMKARIKKAAGSLKITPANASQNAHIAPDFVAAYARHEKAKADCGFNPRAGTHDDEAKRFTTLQAQFAKHGHTLHQSGPGDGPGPVSYLAERWGMARHLPTLGDAEVFLIQVGSAGHEL